MKKSFLLLMIFCGIVVGLTAQSRAYTNPVISRSTPDPTIIRAENGYFYLYATEDIRNTPIYRSEDLLNWALIGTAFTDATRPNFEPRGGIWAPDINYINGKYVLYYSMSVWGGEWTCGIGVAVSNGRTEPNNFIDKGKLFRSDEIGVQNSIDPFFIEDNGQNYLFWGSFRGIYCVELSSDGLSLKNPSANPELIAGTAFEGVYIHKRDDYYYLFASVGSCCDGLNSSYQLVVGRSKSLKGPYVDKQGKPMLSNYSSIVVGSNNRFKGNGHCSEIVQDDNGSDWMFFHGWDAENEKNGRVLLLNRVRWDAQGWPYVDGNSPTVTSSKPVFNKSSSVDNPLETQVKLHVVGNSLVIKSLQTSTVKVYAASGQLINNSDKKDYYHIPLVSGTYLVEISTSTESIVRKILV